MTPIVFCKYGHTHRGRVAARICEAAHRPIVAKKLGTATLIQELRGVIGRAQARNINRSKI